MSFRKAPRCLLVVPAVQVVVLILCIFKCAIPCDGVTFSPLANIISIAQRFSNVVGRSFASLDCFCRLYPDFRFVNVDTITADFYIIRVNLDKIKAIPLEVKAHIVTGHMVIVFQRIAVASMYHPAPRPIDSFACTVSRDVLTVT